MRRVDNYLTRKAAARWPRALVLETPDRAFLLIRHGEEPLVLSGPPTPMERRFRAAKEALLQTIAADEARAP